jgi:hypothetical protein
MNLAKQNDTTRLSLGPCMSVRLYLMSKLHINDLYQEDVEGKSNHAGFNKYYNALNVRIIGAMKMAD